MDDLSPPPPPLYKNYAKILRAKVLPSCANCLTGRKQSLRRINLTCTLTFGPCPIG